MRPILNVDFRSFESSTGAIFEVEFSGNELKFPELLNTAVLGSLNAKFKKIVFHLDSVSGETVKILYKGTHNEDKIIKTFETGPPSSFASASPERLANVALTHTSLAKIKEINPGAVAAVIEYQKAGNSSSSMKTISDF